MKGKKFDYRIQAFRKLSFIVYSIEKESHVITEKSEELSKVFTEITAAIKKYLAKYNNSIEMEAEAFRLIRILFLRFNHSDVKEIIGNLWPIIFTEIFRNFKNESEKENIKVLIEIFKLIEIFSLVNMREFSLYQWSFFLDTFNKEDLNSLLNKLNNNDNGFRPIGVEFIKNSDMKDDDDEIIEGKQDGKSQLAIKIKDESKEELQKAVKKLSYSIIERNISKVELNYDEIENSTENEFLDFFERSVPNKIVIKD